MNQLMHRFGIAGLGLLFASSVAWAGSPLLQEGFDNAGIPAGWSVANFSDNPASEGWFRPISPADTFGAQAGAADSYIATSVFTGVVDANGNPTGRIDTMLATPVISMSDTTVLNFSTRTLTGNPYGETLRVGAIVAGSFVELMTINPSLVAGSYPEQWAQYAVTLPGQGDGITGRYFFEYQVPDAKVAGNFIGLDSVTVSAVPEPGTVALLLGGGVLLAAWRRRSFRA